MKQLSIALALALSLLIGCATRGSSCPPVVEYDQAESVRLADEIDRLPADSIIPEIITEYWVLRRMAKACR